MVGGSEHGYIDSPDRGAIGLANERVRTWLSAQAQTASPSPREQPRPLIAREIEHVSAFSRVMGYVNFFHHREETPRTDWEDLAVRSIALLHSARCL